MAILDYLFYFVYYLIYPLACLSLSTWVGFQVHEYPEYLVNLYGIRFDPTVINGFERLVATQFGNFAPMALETAQAMPFVHLDDVIPPDIRDVGSLLPSTSGSMPFIVETLREATDNYIDLQVHLRSFNPQFERHSYYHTCIEYTSHQIIETNQSVEIIALQTIQTVQDTN